jgi:hypothetical protein
MSLDIRIPIGYFFLLVGIVLVLFGLWSSPELDGLRSLAQSGIGDRFGVTFSGPEIYERHSLGYNVNLIWGVVLAAFGAFMLTMAYRAGRKPEKPAENA